MNHRKLFFFISGIILGSIITLCVAAQPAASGPRYQMSVSGSNIFILDNQTNKISLLFKKRVDGKQLPDWPWACDHSFSVEDAINSPDGALVEDGKGR